MKEMSKGQFKKMVKEKVKKCAFEFLLQIKESHSKLSNIRYDDFKMQDYLADSSFNLREKQLLFRLRSRTFEAKANFRNRYQNNLQCDLCGTCPEQTQKHILEDCDYIISNCADVAENITAEHDDIYRDKSKQLAVTRLYSKIEDIRNALLV